MMRPTGKLDLGFFAGAALCFFCAAKFFAKIPNHSGTKLLMPAAAPKSVQSLTPVARRLSEPVSPSDQLPDGQRLDAEPTGEQRFQEVLHKLRQIENNIFFSKQQEIERHIEQNPALIDSSYQMVQKRNFPEFVGLLQDARPKEIANRMLAIDILREAARGPHKEKVVCMLIQLLQPIDASLKRETRRILSAETAELIEILATATPELARVAVRDHLGDAAVRRYAAWLD